MNRSTSILIATITILGFLGGFIFILMLCAHGVIASTTQLVFAMLGNILLFSVPVIFETVWRERNGN